MLRKLISIAGLCASNLLSRAIADANDAELAGDSVQITATRAPESSDQVPASITIVSGEELRLRGAHDLRSALLLVSGVEGTPGGDSGPAGTVPGLWGLREVDAFLLVVDGVPWGGAFNPATPSIDLSDVERIEVLRGAAPTVFGATSFVGVIQVIHYGAGETPGFATVAGASYGGYSVAGATDLPQWGSFQQSLTANLEKRGYAEDRTDYQRYHGLYRGRLDLDSAVLHIDGDISILAQTPSGNLLLLDGATLHNELPADANYNPAGAKLDQQRYALNLGLEGKAPLGDWSITLSATRTLNDILRGFLRGDAFIKPPDAGVGDGLQADGYSQRAAITDLYFDAHLVQPLSTALQLLYGVDYLYGNGAEHAVNFAYCVSATGYERPCAGARHADELVYSDDERGFAGGYAQLNWQLDPSLDLLAGLRLNDTRETAHGVAIDNTGTVPVVAFDGSGQRRTTRWSGTLGVNWKSWVSGGNALTWYADYRNTFKPLAVDFGPEAEVHVLEPETGVSYEVGAKSQLLDGRLDLDASLFRMCFRNGLTYTQGANGQFGPSNSGESRFQGFEIESRYQLAGAWQFAAHYANHDARYVAFTEGDGVDVSGHRIEMSPRQLGGLGLLYAPPVRLGGSVVVDYVGPRELNAANTVAAGGYSTVDASLRYAAGRYRWQLDGYNLGNAGGPVVGSELNQSVTVTHTAGYYRLPGRLLQLEMRYAW